jgi:hypothetical protein
VLGSVASAINLQHGRGENDVSAYEAVYVQKMDHDFSCSNEEVCRCWTVPERLKVTNGPEFTEYACEKYIINDDKICDDDAKGYFSDISLPSDEKEEVLDEYFFDHLQDDITEDSHGKRCWTSTFLIICRMTSLKTVMERVRDIILSTNLMQKATMTLLILFAMFLRQAMMKAPSRAL